uniref:VWFC domain-containing protein n=1 Tax=Glossina morsitans morsitans TaxID=37546 RepID=A0A1B0G589_GLOMM
MRGTQLLHRALRDVAAITTSLLQAKENVKDAVGATSSSSTEITLDQPQGQCLLDGEYVPETTVFCEKQAGCRAIQKTGYCCPDYKCDCEKDGKTYSNGDKLVDPETPCTVCYCQAGEILCSPVTCFHRDDCSPKYITGVCCPEYDNCPVVTSESAANKTFAISSTTARPEMQSPAVLNPKITIKEITKPIEIRITDYPPVHQMLKPSITTTTTTSTTTTTTPSPITNSPMSAIIKLTTTAPTASSNDASSTNSNSNNNNNNNNINNNNNHHHHHHGQESLTKLTALSVDNSQSNEKLTLQLNGGSSSFSSGESLKLAASVAYSSTEQAAAKISSTSNSQESSAELLTWNYGNPSLSEDPTKINIKREYLVSTESVLVDTKAQGGGTSEELVNTEMIYNDNHNDQDNPDSGISSNSGHSDDLDTDTAGSDNIYHIILTTDGSRTTSTTEMQLNMKESTVGGNYPMKEKLEELESNKLSSSVLNTSPTLDSNDKPKQPVVNDKMIPLVDGSDSHKTSSTTEVAMQHHLEDDEAAIPEANPAYPSLPEDDFSLRDINFQLSDSDDTADEPRSVVGSSSVAGKSTKNLDETHYGSGSGMLADELLNLSSSISFSSTFSHSPTSAASFSTTTEGSGENLHIKPAADSYGKRKSEVKIQLIYSGEDLSEETAIANNTNFPTIEQKKINVDEKSVVESKKDLIISDNGSGSGELKIESKKEREPTTAKPKKSTTDIDEVDNASGDGNSELHIDPKLDAESIKLEESNEDTLITPDISPKNNILSAKVNPIHANTNR